MLAVEFSLLQVFSSTPVEAVLICKKKGVGDKREGEPDSWWERCTGSEDEVLRIFFKKVWDPGFLIPECCISSVSLLQPWQLCFATEKSWLLPGKLLPIWTFHPENCWALDLIVIAAS